MVTWSEWKPCGCRNRSQISGKWLAMIYTVSVEGQTGHLCFLVKRSHETTKTSNMLICHHISWLVFSVAGSIMPFVSIEIYIFKKWSQYTIWFIFLKTAGMWDSNWSKQHSFDELLWQIFIWLANEYFQYIWDWVKLTVVPMFTVTKVHKRLFFLISLVTGTYSISVCLCKSLGLFGWNQRTVTADGDCLPQVSCFSPGFAQREFPSLCSQRWPFTKTRPCCRARLCIVGIVLQLRETEFTWRAPAVSSDRLPRFNTSPSQQAGTHWEPGQLYKNEAFFWYFPSKCPMPWPLPHSVD